MKNRRSVARRACDYSVSDEDGCQTRSMTIKADIVCDTSCVFDAGNQGPHQQGTAHEDQHDALRRDARVLSVRTDFCHISDAPSKSTQEVKALAGDKFMRRVVFFKKMDAQTLEALVRASHEQLIMKKE